MTDAESRGNERAFLREHGGDPRRAGAYLLGADPSRFLLLARVETVDPGSPWRRVTGIHAAVGAAPERWRALWAFPLVTFEELQRATAQIPVVVVWDSTALREVPPFADGVQYVRVEDGWRTPPDGPAVVARPERAPALFAAYVVRELRAELERRCAALGLTCRDDATVPLLAATEVTWTTRDARPAVIARARACAQELTRTYSDATGTLVFDVAASGPRTVLVRWTVEAVPTPAPRRRAARRR